MRACNQCGTSKASSEFYIYRPLVCKECVRATVRRFRLSNIELVRARDRKRGYHGTPGYMAKYRAAHPERRAAQVALNNAVRDGRITAWPVCALPDCDCAPEAHHTHYDAALEVVWLCPAHHKQAHALIKRPF